MKKALIPLVLIAALAVCFVVPNESRAYTSVDQIDRQLNKLRQQMNEAKRKAEEAEKNSRLIESQLKANIRDLDELMEKQAALVLQIAEKQNEIDGQEHELDVAEGQLEEIIARIEARDALIRSRLKLMYMRGAVSYLEVLMQSTSFTDFLDRYNALKALLGQDKEILDQTRRDQQAMEDKKEEIEMRLANLTREYDELATMQAQLAAQQKQKEVLIAQLREEKEDHEHVSEEEERRLMELTAEFNKLEKEKNALMAKLKAGTLAYPLPRVYPVTSWFGSRVDPITGAKGAFHNGIDIGAPKGTDILAAGDGVVIQAGWYGGYGNAVIINHGLDKNGNELWTLYGHASEVLVKKGQQVKKGDHIAEVGNTGRSTGNHLHFTVYLNQEAVDPKKYVNF